MGPNPGAPATGEHPWNCPSPESIFEAVPYGLDVPGTATIKPKISNTSNRSGGKYPKMLVWPYSFD